MRSRIASLWPQAATGLLTSSVRPRRRAGTRPSRLPGRGVSSAARSAGPGLCDSCRHRSIVRATVRYPGGARFTVCPGCTPTAATALTALTAPSQR